MSTTAYDFDATALDGSPQPLSDWRGKVLLIVNVASKCGFTPQYAGLEKLWRDYGDKGLVVLGFPSDQFGHQEPGNAEEIRNFCSLTYDVSFPMFAKVEVKGKNATPLYKDLTTKSKSKPRWNFHKYLIHKDGMTVESFSALTKPDSKKLIQAIERAVAEE